MLIILMNINMFHLIKLEKLLKKKLLQENILMKLQKLMKFITGKYIIYLIST